MLEHRDALQLAGWDFEPNPTLPGRLGTFAAVEKLFFQTNVKTALAVGQARGVIMLCIQKAGIEPFEYTPNEVKQAVAGYGGADKKQVQEMVRALLQLDKIPKPDDAADALAIAITHLNTNRY